MYVRSPWLSLFYKVCVFVFGAWIFADCTGFLSGRPDYKAFFYFTNLSNLLCLLFFFGAIVCQTVRLPRFAPFLPRVKGGVVMCILLTMVGYHVFFGGYHGPLSDKTLHYYIPLLTFLDWLLFDRKGTLRPQDPLWWTAFPFAYIVFIMFRAKYGRAVLSAGRFPYYFINADRLGWEAVSRTCLMVFIAFITASYLFFLLDRMLGKVADRRKRKPSE